MLEGFVDVPDGEVKPAYRPVAEKALPIPDFRLGLVDAPGPCIWRRARSGFGGRRYPAAPQQAHGRAGNAVGHHENSDRRTADDLGLGRPLFAGSHLADFRAYKLVDRFDDAALGHADEHNRLLVFDELDACDDTVQVDADQHMHGLARVADSPGEVGIQIGIAEQAVGRIHRKDRRVTLLLTETVPLGKQFLGLRL